MCLGEGGMFLADSSLGNVADERTRGEPACGRQARRCKGTEGSRRDTAKALSRGQSWASDWAGRGKRKLAPRGGLWAAQKGPPCDSTMGGRMPSARTGPVGFAGEKAL